MPDFNFDTSAPVENLESVPSQFHHMFEQGDGGYTVGEQHRPVAEMINGLQANLISTRKNKKEASDESAQRRQQLGSINEIFKARGLEEVNAETLPEFLDGIEAQAAKQAGGNIDERLKAQREEMSRANQKALGERDEQINAMRSNLESVMIDREAIEAISSQKGVSQLLMPLVKNQTRLVQKDDSSYSVQVVDGSGEPRYNGAGDAMSIKELVAEMKSDTNLGRAFEADTPSGTGTKPVTGQKSLSGAVTSQKNADRSSVDKIAAGLNRLKGRR